MLRPKNLLRLKNGCNFAIMSGSWRLESDGSVAEHMWSSPIDAHHLHMHSPWPWRALAIWTQIDVRQMDLSKNERNGHWRVIHWHTYDGCLKCVTCMSPNVAESCWNFGQIYRHQRMYYVIIAFISHSNQEPNFGSSDVIDACWRKLSCSLLAGHTCWFEKWCGGRCSTGEWLCRTTWDSRYSSTSLPLLFDR